MRRGWRLPDFSSASTSPRDSDADADADTDADDDCLSDPAPASPYARVRLPAALRTPTAARARSPTRGDSRCPLGCGWDGTAAAAAAEEEPLGGRCGGGGGGRSFRGLARRLRPFAPRSADELPASRADARRALSRCSQEFALSRLHQRASLPASLVEAALEAESECEPSEFCRICREGASREPLITPCDCRGTVRYVHKSCLERWLAESDTSFCEICGLRYVTERSPRYGVLKTVVLWALTARHDLFVDLLTVLTFVPLAVLGTSMGVTASRSLCYGLLSTSDREGVSNLMLMVEPRVGPLAAQLMCVSAQTLTAAVVAVMAAMDIAVSAWLVLRVQQHAQRCHSWYRRQCVVHLVFPGPPPMLPPAPQPPPEVEVQEDGEGTEEEACAAICAAEDSTPSDNARTLSAALTSTRSRRRRPHKGT